MKNPEKITLRTATIKDLPHLDFWQKQQHLIDAVGEDDWNWAFELQRFPPWREQLIAELEGRPIGFIQIIDPAEEETHYWGEVSDNLRAIDIWIGEKEDLGKGYGTVMMKLAIERCFKDPEVSAILIDPLLSNLAARRFYESMGFRFLEERSFEDDHCAVYELRREDYFV